MSMITRFVFRDFNFFKQTEDDKNQKKSEKGAKNNKGDSIIVV